jgi:hypothetical protein
MSIPHTSSRVTFIATMPRHQMVGFFFVVVKDILRPKYDKAVHTTE